MWDKMTYSIEHSAKLLEEMEELKYILLDSMKK